MSDTRPREALWTLGLLTSFILSGCLSDETPAVSEKPADATALNAVGASIEFTLCPSSEPCGQLTTSVSLKVVDCSAEVVCKDSMMRDQTLGNAPGPTLIASFSCGFPAGSPNQDALMALNPAIRCYTSGDPALPATWQPAGGIPPTFGPGERLAFSQQVNPQGRVFTSWSYLMRPLKTASAAGADWGFCTFEAWGDVVFSDLGAGEPADATCLESSCPRRRDPFHVYRAPVVQWRGIVEWTGTVWDCHTSGANPMTFVERKVIDAAIHDVADPYVKGVWPAIQSYGLLAVEPRTFDAVTVETLVLRFAEETDFPEAPMATPVEMTTRVLRVDSPPGTPVGVKIIKTCSQNNSVRELQRVGVMLADSTSGQTLGAIIIHKELSSGGSTTPWECVRTTSGACELFNEAGWASQTPCLGQP